VAFRHLFPCPGDCGIEQDVGKFRKVIGQFFHAEQAADVLRQQAEDLGVMHFAQDVHLPFGIGLEFLQSRRQLRAKGRPVGQGIEQSRIEQFVEQDGMALQVAGGPTGTADQFGDLLQCLRILLQQGQIGRAL
jgi:hypothetical protein